MHHQARIVAKRACVQTEEELIRIEAESKGMEHTANDVFDEGMWVHSAEVRVLSVYQAYRR